MARAYQSDCIRDCEMFWSLVSSRVSARAEEPGICYRDITIRLQERKVATHAIHATILRRNKLAQKSGIEWTESTWNPVTGCDKISPGCANCYAERMAKRLQAMGQPNYADGFKVALHEHVLETPLTWEKAQMVFVNSMSDLFHRDVPLSFIQRVFDVMQRASWHTFQVLTKRSERLSELAGSSFSSRSWVPLGNSTSLESTGALSVVNPDQVRVL